MAGRFPGGDFVLIVLDTFESAAGFVDSNHSPEAQRAMDMKRPSNARTGAFVLVVDHFDGILRPASWTPAKAQSATAIFADKRLAGTIGDCRMVLPRSRATRALGRRRFRDERVTIGRTLSTGRTYAPSLSGVRPPRQVK